MKEREWEGELPKTVYLNGFRLTLPQKMLVNIIKIDWIEEKSRIQRACALFHGCMELAEQGIPAAIYSIDSNEIAIPVHIGEVTISIDGVEKSVAPVRREVIYKEFLLKMINSIIRYKMESNGYTFAGEMYMKRIDETTWECVYIEFVPIDNEYYIILKVNLIKENICDDLLKLNEPNMDSVIVEVKKKGEKTLKYGVISDIIDNNISEYKITLGTGEKWSIYEYYMKRGEQLDPNMSPIYLVKMDGVELPFPLCKIVLRGIEECVVRISPQKEWNKIISLVHEIFDPPLKMGEYIISSSKKPKPVFTDNSNNKSSEFLIPKGWPRGPLLRFKKGLSRDPRSVFLLHPSGMEETINVIVFTPQNIDVRRAMVGIKTELKKIGIDMEFMVNVYENDPIAIKNMPLYEMNISGNVSAFAVVPEDTSLSTLHSIEKAVNIMDWNIHFMRESAFKSRLEKAYLKRELLRTGLTLLVSAIRNKLFSLTSPYFIGWDMKFPTGGARFPNEVLHVGCAITRPYTKTRGLVSVILNASGHILGAHTLHLNGNLDRYREWWRYILSRVTIPPWRTVLYLDPKIKSNEIEALKKIILEHSETKTQVDAVVVNWNSNRLLFGETSNNEIIAPPSGSTYVNGNDFSTVPWQPTDNKWIINAVHIYPVFTTNNRNVDQSIVMEYLDLTRVNWWILLGPVLKNMPLELATRLAALFQRS
ncbi:MAG: hypothetical protein QXL15_02420 [Candidatus Korarchaeota archaeon]